jgi:quercetin dioxygenase-like cupin family protein
MPTTPPHELIRVGQIEVQFRLDASQTGGAFTMFEFRVPVAARVPVPHSHESFDETVFGLDAVMTWMLSGESVTVGPGDVLFIPRGAVHGFDNRGTAAARGLSVVTPGLLGPAFFREIGAVVNAGGPPDIARIREVMLRHGLRPVVPA